MPTTPSMPTMSDPMNPPPGGPGPNAKPGDEGLAELALAVDQMGAEMNDRAAPVPDTPYSMSAVRSLLKVMKDVASEFPGFPAPTELAASKGQMGSTWSGQLPMDLWRPLVALANTITQINTDGRFDEYAFDPMDATSNDGLMDIVTRITMGMKDPKFVSALQEGPGESEGGAGETPSEGEMEDDMSGYMERMP